MQAARQNSGFTLIELMVTIAVLAILLGIAIPSFQGTLDKRRIIGAAEQIYADLQYARSEAIKRNATVRVSFQTGTNWCYGITTLASCNCHTADNCQLDGVNKVVVGADFRNVTLSTGGVTTTVAFTPQRGTANALTASLLRSTSPALSVGVIVSSLGRVRICSDNVPDYKPSSGSC